MGEGCLLEHGDRALERAGFPDPDLRWNGPQEANWASPRARRPGTTHTGTTHTVQDQSSLFSARLPGLCSGVSTALWGRLQLLFGLRAGVGCCLLERVTEAQLEAAPWLTPAPGHRRAPCRPGAEKGNPGAGAPTGTGTVGSSAGSWPPLSRNLEKVSRSLVLLYSIT